MQTNLNPKVNKRLKNETVLPLRFRDWTKHWVTPKIVYTICHLYSFVLDNQLQPGCMCFLRSACSPAPGCNVKLTFRMLFLPLGTSLLPRQSSKKPCRLPLYWLLKIHVAKVTKTSLQRSGQRQPRVLSTVNIIIVQVIRLQ